MDVMDVDGQIFITLQSACVPIQRANITIPFTQNSINAVHAHAYSHRVSYIYHSGHRRHLFVSIMIKGIRKVIDN